MNPAMLFSRAERLAVAGVTRLGARVSGSMLRLAERPEVDAEVIELFLRATTRARQAPTEQTLRAFDLAAQRLESVATRILSPEDLQAFRREIQQHSNVIAHHAQTLGLPMPASARFRAILSQELRVTLALASARYQATFLKRLGTLSRGTLSDRQQLALLTYRRILAVAGDELEDGWSRVFDYCAKNAPKMATTVRKLRDLEAQGVKGASAVLRQELHRVAEGFLFPIRGELGEIYLHHWPAWRIQLESLEEVAAREARKLGPGWVPKRFSGGAMIDGKKAWDEGILLIKSSTMDDRFPRAALHTAAQVKVEKRLTAVAQILKDRHRETGSGMTPATLTLFEGNHRRDFVLETLPPSVEPVRYLFNAPNGRLSATDIARLRTAGLQVNQMPLDISIDGFNALGRELVDTAADYAP